MYNHGARGGERRREEAEARADAGARGGGDALLRRRLELARLEVDALGPDHRGRARVGLGLLLEVLELLARERAVRRHREREHELGVAEEREVGRRGLAVHEAREVLHEHLVADVGLVDAVVAHRDVVRHALERGQLGADELLEDRAHDALRELEDVVLLDKAHLARSQQTERRAAEGAVSAEARRGARRPVSERSRAGVNLRELRLTVGAQLLVAEALGDLEVPVHPADHAHLLERLRRLRQRVELAWPRARARRCPHTTREEATWRRRRRHAAHQGWLATARRSRARPRAGLDEDGRLDLGRRARAELVAHELGHLVAEQQRVRIGSRRCRGSGTASGAPRARPCPSG